MAAQPVTLAEVVRHRGPLPCRTAAEYIRQAAEQLERAHRHGMVHCDIKPELLLLDGEEILVVDVLAFARGPGAPLRLHPTDVNRLFHVPTLPNHELPWVTIPPPRDANLGTVDYLAPEAAMGDRVDHRRDIYSLGCVFYFLLAARPVFVGGTLAETLIMHIYEPPVPIREWRADVPTSLWQILEQMLAKQPEDRFASAAEVATALGNCSARIDGKVPPRACPAGRHQ